ncbi:MAG: protein kinase [Vulcanimicrobiota bacterium]
MFTPGVVLQDRYRIDKLLGEGGMSYVYLAHHLQLDRPVALKVVKLLYADPNEARQHAEQLQVEARIMARLDHPNLARVLDMFLEGNIPVLVMELITGRDLEQTAILAPKPIAQRRVMAWARQLLDVLEYLHTQEPPVIVRDLKPSNVMLGHDGRLRLIDFGLAKMASGQGGTRAIVRGMGSEGYAPLEQYAKASTDARSDLYAFGATLYFMLTDEVPPPASLRVAHGAPVKDPRIINDSVTQDLWTAIEKLMALNPDERPPTAAEARRLLGLDEGKPDDGRRRCVQCSTTLTTVVRRGVEIDRCPECGGVWLDKGELSRLTETGKPQSLPRPAALGPAPKKRPRKVDSDELETKSLWQSLLEFLDLD